MASQKVRSPALQCLFKTSTYNMYVFTLEQPLRLGVRNFCLAIFSGFYETSKIEERNSGESSLYCCPTGMTLIVLLKE